MRFLGFRQARTISGRTSCIHSGVTHGSSAWDLKQTRGRLERYIVATATSPTAGVRDIGKVSMTVVAVYRRRLVTLSDFPYDPFCGAAS